MRKIMKTLCLLAAILVVVATAVAQEDAQARKAGILANLKMQYPQLADVNVVMGEIVPTDFEGLDEGTFTVPGRGVQKFLVSSDNTKLYLTGDPIDVSKSETEIQAALVDQAAAKTREAEERQTQLIEVSAGLPARGNPEAPVLIVEFSDFQCPYCARGASTVDEILEKYPDDVKVVFKHFPLGFHNWAKPAAIASYCAGLQSGDAFWKLHDEYFQGQKALNLKNVMEKSKGFLEGTDIDIDKWSTCAENEESEEHKAASAVVDADMALGQSLGVSGTPAFCFIRSARVT